jgi:tripartite-type tricarboxylate transporter receptor subunit TctC
MEFQRRQILYLAAGAAALPGLSLTAGAQAYPTRPITLVVGFAAGGPDDTSARILAGRMQNLLGQSVVIENVTGAGGSIGAGRVARAPADGYTIAFGDFSTHAVNSALYTLSYDIVNDFEPICLTNKGPFLLVARSSIPATNFSEFIKFLRTNSSKATAGTAGVGSVAHVLSILLEKETGSKFQMIPYRGNALALQDLVAGQIDFMFDPPATSMGHIRDKRLKAFAVTDTRRLPSAPDIPTIDEVGLPQLRFSYWQSLWAPKGTPKDIIAILNAVIVKALAEPATHSRFAELALDTFPREQQTPEALATWQRAEIEKWGAIIKAAGIRVEQR